MNILNIFKLTQVVTLNIFKLTLKIIHTILNIQMDSESHISIEYNIEYNFEKLEYKSPKMSSFGMKNISIQYDKNNFLINTPKMLTFGINKWTFQNGQSSDSITFSFFNMENNINLAKFHSFLLKLDDWAIHSIHKNSWEWLGIKNITLDEVEKNYHTTIKKSINSKPDFLKIKLRNSQNGYTTTFFNLEKEQISTENIEQVFVKGSYAKGLLQCVGFWFMEDKYGLSWKLTQVLVKPRKSLTFENKVDYSKCLIDD